MSHPFTLHTQQHLLHQLATPLGKDVLVPVTVHGQDAMSVGFTYRLECYSEQRHDIEPKELLGKPVTFDVAREDGGIRYFNGYVKRFRPLGLTYGEQRMTYEMAVVPWLWFLEQTSDCRVFQHKSIPEVIRSICDEWKGYGKAAFSVNAGSHAKERFLVQYNESTYNFVARLCRRAGIFFYITHKNGGHTVNFCDDPLRVPSLDPSELVLHSGTAAHNHLTAWSRETRHGAGELTEATYNYVNPRPVAVRRSAPQSLLELPQARNLRRYEYTEEFQAPEDGRHHARRRMACQSQRHQLVKGTATYRTLGPGFHFKVTGRPDGGDFVDEGGRFTLTRVSIRATNSSGAASWVTGFEAVPRGEAVYPRGERPTMAGLQTAVVTGHHRDTVHTDHDGKQLGRVKVQFHWDRDGGEDANSSCWLRVMQNGAGNGFAGFYALPRVGTEVVVAFENGNPDRPFVLGALPHPGNRPPYGDDPHRSGIRTQSFDAIAGAAAGKWNELRFDDRKDAEEVYLRAEKDYKALIKNNARQEVGNDATEKVGNNLMVTVSASETRDLGQELTVTAGTSITLKVGGNSVRIDATGISITGGAVTINGNPTSIN